MFFQITINKEKVKNICPNCGNQTLEWTGGKVDKTQQEYQCMPCRMFIVLEGMTREDQEEIASTAFN